MDILKGKILLFTFICCFVSCDRLELNTIEHVFGMDFRKSLTRVLVDECWFSFNGNGEKVVYYEIKDAYIQEITEEAMANEFFRGNQASLPHLCSERESKYLKSDEFLYKTIDKDNESFRLIVDYKTSHLIFYYMVY